MSYNSDLQVRFDRFVDRYVIKDEVIKYDDLSYDEFLDVCVYISACDGYVPCRLNGYVVNCDILSVMKNAATVNIKNKWGKEFLDQYKEISKYGRDLILNCSLYQLYVPQSMFIQVVERKYIIKTMLSIISKKFQKYSSIIDYLVKDNRLYMNDSFVIDFSDVILKSLYNNSGKVDMGDIVKGMYAYGSNVFDFYSEVN